MDSLSGMIRATFLSATDRAALIALAKNGSAPHWIARRANALVLLDGGMSCVEVGKVLFLDDDTVRTWHKLYCERGIAGLSERELGGSASHLSEVQEHALVAWITETLPRSADHVGAYIERAFGVVYESRSGLIALLHRLGFEYKKPETIGRKLDPEKQQAFIKVYEDLLNSMGPDEAVMFVDAVHPTHATRPVGCWAPAKQDLAIEQTTGRQRLNIHGALDLETGQTAMIDVETVDAVSTIRLLQAIEAMYPLLVMIHVFLDNARYHHAVSVQEWLAQPGRRIKLHFIPAYCPHLNPIERLWGVMHKHMTHNKHYQAYREFADDMLKFLRQTVPRRWPEFRDSVTDNFRVIDPNDFRVLA
jgi:transposase